MPHAPFDPRTAACVLVSIGLTCLGCGERRNGSVQPQLAPAASTATEPSPAPAQADPPKEPELRSGADAYGDWTSDAPGVRRKLTAADMVAPNTTKSVTNRPDEVDPPKGTLPRVPSGFRVGRFADKLDEPRMLRSAPNGDVFVAESKADRVRVLRDADGDGTAELRETFSDDLNKPFGIAFFPPGSNPTHVYIANTDSVVRFAYSSGDVQARAKPEKVVAKLPAGGMLFGGGHWTRDIVFSNDGSKLYVSVGSASNVDDDSAEARRARIFEYSPDGRQQRVYAWGIRNPVGLAIEPSTGELWTSVNERDEEGDDLVPDYVTRVTDGGFYGWPWFYIGAHQDPHHPGKRPELKDKVIVPDVLIQPHSASLGMAFYTGEAFPSEYRHGAYAAQHGSWNRSKATGFKVVFVPVQQGKASGEYRDFMTGFVTSDGDVWGRPVAVAQAHDGALLVSDDTGDVIWRVAAAK